MQLGFDRQHFTLPRVGNFPELNKGLLYHHLASGQILG